MAGEQLLPPIPPTSFEPLPSNFGTTEIPPTPKPSRRGIFIGVLALLVVGAGSLATLAYFVFRWQRPKPPPQLTDAQILAQALDALPGMKSGAVRFDFSFAAEPREAGAQSFTAMPGLAERRQALTRDAERISEIQSIALERLDEYGRLNGQPCRQTRPALDDCTTVVFPTTLELAVPDTDERTDPSGTPYQYSSDGKDYQLTFRLETDAAVEEWNKQLDGLRRYSSSDAAPPRAAVNQNITLTSFSDFPSVYFSASDDPLVALDTQSLEFYKMIPSDLNVSFNARTEFSTNATALKDSDASVGVGGKVSMGGLSFAGDGELRKIAENLYGRVNEFPIPFGPVDFGAIKGKWVVITPEDLVGVDESFSFITRQDVFSETNEKAIEQARLVIRLVQEEGVLSVGQVLPTVVEDGGRYRRYRINFDRTKLVSFVQKLAEQLPDGFGSAGAGKNNAEVIKELEGSDFAMLFDALAKESAAEIWVGEQTMLPHKFTYSLRMVPQNSIVKHAGKQFRLTLAMTLDKINQPVTIEVPAPTTSFDEATALVTGQSPAVIKLQRQLRNIEAIRDALERYHTRTHQYPEALAELQRPLSELPRATPVPVSSGSLGSRVNTGLGYATVVGLDDPGSDLSWSEQPADEKNPLLKKIPNDVYTGNPYPYQRGNDDYTLRYTIKKPTKEETAASGFSRYALYADDKFIEGDNTADAEVQSREYAATKDTDNDGLTDYEEKSIYHTSPYRADTDGDDFSDSVEVKSGFDPNGPGRLVPSGAPSPTPAPGVAAPTGFQPRSYDTKRVADIKQIQTALELYFNDENSYPPSSLPIDLGHDVTCLDSKGLQLSCQSGSGVTMYMGRIPTDPSGLYQYTAYPNEKNPKVTMQYCIEFMLYHDTGGLKAGKNYASESGTASSCIHQ